LQIVVRFFTILREVTGKKEEIIEVLDNEEATVNSVLSKLSVEYGTPFVEYVYEAKAHYVKGFLQFFINGKSVSALKGLGSELKNGDVLAIVPPVGGG
jgi:molybdopterin synthase sulfur carrier subunit